MHGPPADERALALAVENVRLVRDSATELRRLLASTRSHAARVQDAHRLANARLRKSEPPNPLAGGTGAGPRLTSRERAILTLIAEGLDNEEIAERLNFGHGTIKLHVRGILAKFGTSNRTVAAVRAVRFGII